MLKKGDKANPLVIFLTIMGFAVLAVRLLVYSDTFNSSLLYVGWPFAISLAIYYLTPDMKGKSWKRTFWNGFRQSMIMLLGCSLILMEGYVCVVMFLPIYFIGILLAFIFSYLKNRHGGKSVQANVVLLGVILMSMEGVTEETTFNRYNEVVYEQVVHSSSKSILERLSTPEQPTEPRHWLLSIFPMPKTIGAVAIRQGATRTYDFEYHRWIAGNTHRGQLQVRFDQVNDSGITTTITDTSYLSSYLQLHGSELSFSPIDDTTTKVALTVKFDRKIDPIWYFEPLQRFAVRKSAEYFIGMVLANENSKVQLPYMGGQ